MQNIFNLLAKLTCTTNITLAVLVTPLIEMLDAFVLPDFAFILNLVVIVIIDTILGILAGIKRKELSSSEFAKFFTKVIVYCLFVTATHMASHIKINGDENILLVWLDPFIYSSIMCREILSIIEKTTLLGYFKAPQWLLDKLKITQDGGDASSK